MLSLEEVAGFEKCEENYRVQSDVQYHACEDQRDEMGGASAI